MYMRNLNFILLTGNAVRNHTGIRISSPFSKRFSKVIVENIIFYWLIYYIQRNTCSENLISKICPLIRVYMCTLATSLNGDIILMHWKWTNKYCVYFEIPKH